MFHTTQICSLLSHFTSILVQNEVVAQLSSSGSALVLFLLPYIKLP